MDHDEAIKQMAAERYLLDELSPELREAFEEHAFDCHECALDLRAGGAFIRMAKAELPNLAEATPAPAGPAVRRERSGGSLLLILLRPALAVPAFAALLSVIAFQNLSTIPRLRSAAGDPRILPETYFHAGTRGAEHLSVRADRAQGAMLSIDLVRDPGYTAYAFTLSDPQGKEQWTRTVSASSVEAEEGTVSLFLPGQSLRNGSYTLAITGIADQGGRTGKEIDRRVLDIQLAN